MRWKAVQCMDVHKKQAFDVAQQKSEPIFLWTLIFSGSVLKTQLIFFLS